MCPEMPSMVECSNKLCEWLEEEAELYTLVELHERMIDIAGSNDVYSVKRLKQKFQDKYKDFIFFAEIQGRKNVVCLRNMADFIINEKWYEAKKQVIQDKSERIIACAAKIIKAEIREMTFKTDTYPSNHDIWDTDSGLEWLPPLLKNFMNKITKSKIQQASIGQCIVRSARPRSVIPPLVFGIGVTLDYIFGSKWLINELARLGYSVSYDEVVRFKQNVVYSETFDKILPKYPHSVTQWVADNVDHNVCTLDGNDTFHGMEIIAATTHSGQQPLSIESPPVKRQKKTKVQTLVANKGIPIKSYEEPQEKGLSSVMFKRLVELEVPYVLSGSFDSALLWHSTWGFCSCDDLRPSWTGFMQDVSTGTHPPPSDITMLPIIDLNPSNETCIYSTLLYVKDQAKQLNVPTICITFDQPSGGRLRR